MHTVPWEQVLRWRVHRQFLAGAKARTGVAVASRLMGVHAQLANSATTAIRLRADVTAKSVEGAIQRGSLVKTWAARGTLHLLAKSQYPTWVAVMSTRSRETRQSWLRYHGLTAAGMTRLLEALPEALGDEPRTRDELAERVVRITGDEKLREPLTHSWGGVLKPAAFRGLLTFGPPRGRNVTFVSPGPVEEVDVDEAFDTLIKGYLDAYGPLDADELSRAVDIPITLTKRSLKRLEEAGVAETVLAGAETVKAGATQRVATNVDAIMGATDAGVHLLPAFDPYVTGSLKQLAEIVSGDHTAEVSRPQGWITPVVLVDGRIAGVWKVDAEQLDVTMFEQVRPAVKQQVKAAAERLATASGDGALPVDVRLG